MGAGAVDAPAYHSTTATLRPTPKSGSQAINDLNAPVAILLNVRVSSL